MEESQRRFTRGAVLLALSLGYLAYFFRAFTPAFWQSGIGDWIDPYFINSLFEHWYHAVTHFVSPASPPVFYPVARTLGYSHGLILSAPFYLAVRPFLHPFIADSVTMILIIECGVICLYLLFRKFGALSVTEAVLLTAFFTTSANILNIPTVVWSQRLSVFLIPPIVLLGFATVRVQKPALRILLAAFTGLLAALLLVQDFPNALFTVFVSALVTAPVLLYWMMVWTRRQDAFVKSAIVIAIAALLWSFFVTIGAGIDVRIGHLRIASDRWQRPVVVACLLIVFIVIRSRVFTRLSGWSVAGVIGAAVGVAAFLWLYLPIYRQHPSFPKENLLNAMDLRDPARWHSLFDFMRDLRAYNTLRPFALALIVIVLLWVRRSETTRAARLWALWFGIVSLLVLVAPIRFRTISLWLTLFEHVPAFGAMRDPRRIIYLYELALVLLLALLLTTLRADSLLRRAVPLIVLVLIVAAWNQETIPFSRPIATFERWVDRPIDIDRSCRCFFIKGASDYYMSRSPHMAALYGVDAAFIALHHSIPTLNGYSAFEPDDWGLANPQESGYTEAVDRWIRRYGLTNVCALDIDRRTMTPYRPGP